MKFNPRPKSHSIIQFIIQIICLAYYITYKEGFIFSISFIALFYFWLNGVLVYNTISIEPHGLVVINYCKFWKATQYFLKEDIVKIQFKYMVAKQHQSSWRITFNMKNGKEKNFRMQFVEDRDAKSMYQYIRDTGYVIENY